MKPVDQLREERTAGLTFLFLGGTLTLTFVDVAVLVGLFFLLLGVYLLIGVHRDG